MRPLPQVAQGDVLFTDITALPKDKQPKGKLSKAQADGKRWIFARGEVTGHHHSAPVEAGTLSLDEGGVMFFTVDELTEVTHQEHGIQVLEPGKTYRVDRQQELGWDGWRQVAD